MWSVFCGLVVFIGFLFLFVPGIYIGISFTFGSYLLILRDNGLENYLGINGYGEGKLVEDFRVYSRDVPIGRCCAYLFGIPYMFVMMSSAFTGAIPNIY